MANSHHDDHENDLIEGAPRRGGGAYSRAGDRSDVKTGNGSGGARPGVRPGEHGEVALRTIALFAIGFVLGAVAIGTMGIAVTPVDPPAIRPIELRSPDEVDRSHDRGDRRRDRVEPRRGAESRARARRRAPVTPQARPGAPAQPVPPAAGPRSRPPAAAPRPTPLAPRRTPTPRSRPQPQAAPTPAPPPAEDDGGDPDAGEADGAEGGED